MTENSLNAVMRELLELHPRLEPVSETLKNLIRESEFTPDQIFAITLLASGISKDTSALYFSIAEKRFEALQKAFESQAKLGEVVGRDNLKIRESIKQFAIGLIDALNSQFEAEGINIKIDLDIT